MPYCVKWFNISYGGHHSKSKDGAWVDFRGSAYCQAHRNANKVKRLKWAKVQTLKMSFGLMRLPSSWNHTAVGG